MMPALNTQLHKIYKKALNISYRLDDSKALSAMRQGFVFTVPLIMAGALCALLINFPLPIIAEKMKDSGYFINILYGVYQATTDMMSLYLTIGIAFSYAKYYCHSSFSLNIVPVFVSIACFAVTHGAMTGEFAVTAFGPSGVLSSIICGILGTRMFFIVYNFIIKKLHYDAPGTSRVYKVCISAILPAIACVLAFALIDILIVSIFDVNNISDILINSCKSLFSLLPDNLFSAVVYAFLSHFFWLFGIHGDNLLDTSFVAAFSRITPNPATQGMSKMFVDVFIPIGGSGATLGLIIAILLFSKRKANRTLAKTSIFFGIFNINEIILYGLPIVLNPIMAIPFLLAPILNAIICYSAFATGLINMQSQYVIWSTPPIFSGYAATGSIFGSIVQLICIVVNCLVYMPFVRAADKIAFERETLNVNRMIDNFFTNQSQDLHIAYLSQQNDLGSLARAMCVQLNKDIKAENIPVHFQPQIDANEKLFGCEALLRWRYNGCAIPPQLAIQLSDEDGSFNQLTKCILHNSCTALQEYCHINGEGLRMSVNISALQLNNTAFTNELINIAYAHSANNYLELEITEEVRITHYENIKQNIALLQESGIMLSIDDFSMGQTSLKYLQNNNFSFVKLDGALVKQIVENERAKEIVQSIILLGKSLNYQIVAEYVESREIRDTLAELGCTYFQGYLYGKAMPFDEFSRQYSCTNSE